MNIKNFKNRKALRHRSLSQNYDFCTCLSEKVVKHDATFSRKKCKCNIAKAFSSRLELIWKYLGRKSPKMSKVHFWQKAPGVNG